MTTAIAGKDATADTRAGRVDRKLEVITIPVSDLDRAKEFYVGGTPRTWWQSRQGPNCRPEEAEMCSKSEAPYGHEC